MKRDQRSEVPQTRVDRFIAWARDHWLVSIVILIAIIVIGTGKVFDAVDEIVEHVRPTSDAATGDKKPLRTLEADLVLTWAKRTPVWRKKKTLTKHIGTDSMDGLRPRPGDERSPDGKWKASVKTESISIDADAKTQRLVNVSLEPISGPIPWSAKSLQKLPSDVDPTSVVGRVTGWSHPVIYLLKADLEELEFEYDGSRENKAISFSGNTAAFEVPQGVNNATISGVVNGRRVDVEVGKDSEEFRCTQKELQGDSSTRYVYVEG